MIYFEWLGTILALLGAIFMALKNVEKKYSWILWIISSVIFIILFLNSKQYGLVFMNFVGLNTSILGYIQWRNNNFTSPLLMTLLFNLSSITLLGSICFLIYFFNTFTIFSFEWFGSLLSVTATLLMASKHRLHQFSWIFWTISNFCLFLFGFYTQKFGFMLLQLGFCIPNLYGLYQLIIHLYTTKKVS